MRKAWFALVVESNDRIVADEVAELLDVHPSVLEATVVQVTERTYERLLDVPEKPAVIPMEFVLDGREDFSEFSEEDWLYEQIIIRCQDFGKDLWSVMRHGHYRLNASGTWGIEPQPSSRSDHYKNRTRWPLDEAIQRARKAYPNVLRRYQETVERRREYYRQQEASRGE